MLRARDAWRVGLHVAVGGAEVQRTPATAPVTLIGTGAATATDPTAIPLASLRPDRDDNRPALLNRDRFNDRSAQPQQPVPYASLAHVAVAPFMDSRP